MPAVWLTWELDGDTQALFRRTPAVMSQALERALGRAALELSREMRRRVAKAESTAANSITVDNLGKLVRFVGPHVVHAVYLEKGTEGPYRAMPPLQSILDWVRTVGVRPLNSSWTDEDTAWAIARSIQRRGTPAQPFVEPSYQMFRRRFRELMAEGVRRGVEAARRET